MARVIHCILCSLAFVIHTEVSIGDLNLADLRIPLLTLVFEIGKMLLKKVVLYLPIQHVSLISMQLFSGNHTSLIVKDTPLHVLDALAIYTVKAKGAAFTLSTRQRFKQ